MNLQELKDRVVLIAKCYEHSEAAIEVINYSFLEFEKSEKENKQEPKIYESFGHTIRCDHTLIDEKIESMQKEIENIKGINGLNFESHAKRLNKIEEKLEPEPKQERFYYLQFIPECSDFEYEVIDRKGLFDCDGIFTKSQAFEICKALNQMECGWK